MPLKSKNTVKEYFRDFVNTALMYVYMYVSACKTIISILLPMCALD